MPDSTSTSEKLLQLSHALGREDRALAILGEGNTSARTGSGTFLVKASGSSLQTLDGSGITECRIQQLVDLLDAKDLKDDAFEAALFESRVDQKSRKPSIEAIFHAWLLTLPGVEFIGHTHPVSVNALLCSARAPDLAAKRLFPDEVVCCGTQSVLVPYVDPGPELARAIRAGVMKHCDRIGCVPRIVLLANHGLIALGRTPEAVIAATLMAEKAAAITLGACAAGGPIYLDPDDVARIAGRSDEHYRQKMLGL